LNNLGVYFFLDPAGKVPIAGDFEFLIELPPEITLSTCCRIRCRGRLLRKDNASVNLIGMAAEILEYSIQRGAEAAA